MKKRYKVLISIIVVLIVALFVLINSSDVQELYPIRKGKINLSLLLLGKIEDDEIAKVGFEVSGEIDEIFVKEGTEVKEGDIIAHIHNNSIINEVTSAKSQLQQAKSTYIAHLKAGVAVAKNNIEELKRDYDIALARYNNAKDRLAHTYIKSPLSGKIIALLVKRGEVLNTNTQFKEVAVIAPSLLIAKLEVSEVDVDKVKVGAHIQFTDLADKRGCNGVVTNIADAPTYFFTGGSGTGEASFYYITARINKDCQHLYRIGNNIKAQLDYATSQGIVVPLEYIDSNNFVYLARWNWLNQLKRDTKIKVHIIQSDGIEAIVEGLRDDLILIKPPRKK